MLAGISMPLVQCLVDASTANLNGETLNGDSPIIPLFTLFVPDTTAIRLIPHPGAPGTGHTPALPIGELPR
ncbi:hypothetical protein GCM10027180_29960 [Microbulbifer echini]